MVKKVCAERGMVTDGWVSLDPADIGLAEGVYKKNIREGEERLMLAVLESAVEDFQTYVLARSTAGKKLFQQAQEWFLGKDGDELFSFGSICETLGLHPDPIRKGLMVWKEAKLKTLSDEGHRQGGTKLASTRIRHHPVRFSKIHSEL
jgi:hypothetical protein